MFQNGFANMEQRTSIACNVGLSAIYLPLQVGSLVGPLSCYPVSCECAHHHPQLWPCGKLSQSGGAFTPFAASFCCMDLYGSLLLLSFLFMPLQWSLQCLGKCLSVLSPHSSSERPSWEGAGQSRELLLAGKLVQKVWGGHRQWNPGKRCVLREDVSAVG